MRRAPADPFANAVLWLALAVGAALWYIVASAPIEPARADVDALRVYEVRQIIAAEDELTARLIACGPHHAEVVCEVVEVSR